MKNLFILPLLAFALSACGHKGVHNLPCPSHSIVKKHSRVVQLNDDSTSVLTMGGLSGRCHLKLNGEMETQFITRVNLHHKGKTFKPVTAAYYMALIDPTGNVVHRHDGALTFKTQDQPYQKVTLSMNFLPKGTYKPEKHQVLVGFMLNDKQKTDLKKFTAHRNKIPTLKEMTKNRIQRLGDSS